MEQRIRGHFSEAQCLVVILEKPAAFVVKMAKISTSRAALQYRSDYWTASGGS
jgi:hypothetical protein